MDGSEPYAANALRVGDRVIYPTGYPRTRERLEAAGVNILDMDVTELIKAEGAVTCVASFLTLCQNEKPLDIQNVIHCKEAVRVVSTYRWRVSASGRGIDD